MVWCDSVLKLQFYSQVLISKGTHESQGNLKAIQGGAERNKRPKTPNANVDPGKMSHSFSNSSSFENVVAL